jgi:hypothetical protein
MIEQKTVGGIDVIEPASKNLDSVRFSRLLFLFELEQFTLCGASAVLDLSLRQGRNGSSSAKKKHKAYPSAVIKVECDEASPMLIGTSSCLVQIRSSMLVVCSVCQ